LGTQITVHLDDTSSLDFDEVVFKLQDYAFVCEAMMDVELLETTSRTLQLPEGDTCRVFRLLVTVWEDTGQGLQSFQLQKDGMD
jgi:hypothetical protein